MPTPGVLPDFPRVAITREPSRSIEQCELTHVAREPIDLEQLRRDHDSYERTLERLGCQLVRLTEEPALPDSMFVEDTALVLDEVAVLLRPGAASRQPEVATVATALAAFLPLVRMSAAGTLDGGDVLRLGRRLMVGISGRSDEPGVRELARCVEPWGYTVERVAITGCLHLKSAVTQVAEDTLLVQPRWVDLAALAGWRLLEVDPSEPGAANALRIGESLLFPSEFPATAARLEGIGLRLERIAVAEIAKAEGAVTCCSLIVENGGSRMETVE